MTCIVSAVSIGTDTHMLTPCLQVYRILMQQTSSVQPLSCDEAFIDVTGLGDPEVIARQLRAQIEAETGCTASAGIGPNMLLARLATKRAKPNGQFHINLVQVRWFCQSYFHLLVEHQP